MTHQPRPSWIRVGIMVALLGVAGVALLRAQATSGVAELRRQLIPRYDIIPLQQGVALVPRRQNPSARLIQVAGGVVTVDGEAVTGKQLSDKLGRDAGLILQVTYLDPAGQRELAAAAPTPLSPTSPARPTPDAGDTLSRSDVRYGDVVRFGGGVTVSKNERVQGEVVAIFGPADIDGEVTRDVTVIMGPLTLGPNAVVRGNVTVVAGRLSREDGATVSGTIEEVGIGNQGVPVRDIAPQPGRFRDRLRSFGRGGGSLVGTTIRIALLVLLSLVAVAFWHAGIEQIGERAAISPVRAGLVGLLAEVLFVPTVVVVVVVLAVSIVGIPLLLLVPFAIAAVILLMLVGFAGVAYHLGIRVAQRLGLSAGAYLTLTVGVLAVAGLTLVARLAGAAGGAFISAPIVALGFLVEYLAWTIGFGAVILTWFDRRHPGFGKGPDAVSPSPERIHG